MIAAFCRHTVCSVLAFLLFSALCIPGRATAQITPADLTAAAWMATSGAPQMQALAASYSDIISDLAYRHDQWSFVIGGTRFYWADGRILPGTLRDDWKDYASIRFYRYATGVPTLPEVSPELAERLRNRQAGPSRNGPSRATAFLDALYGMSSPKDAATQIVSVTFLGRRARVNRMVAGPLSKVEADIRRAAVNDPQTSRFVDGLKEISGYYWRNIAGSNSRSYHSYGIAVDLIPRYYGGKYGYWRWAVDAGVEQWWAVPFDKRWSVPQPVIDAFERHGFVWGGKWLFYDPIHFEYRPEVILLSKWRERLPVPDGRD